MQRVAAPQVALTLQQAARPQAGQALRPVVVQLVAAVWAVQLPVVRTRVADRQREAREIRVADRQREAWRTRVADRQREA